MAIQVQPRQIKFDTEIDDYTDLHQLAVPLLNGIKIQEYVVSQRL